MKIKQFIYSNSIWLLLLFMGIYFGNHYFELEHNRTFKIEQYNIQISNNLTADGQILDMDKHKILASELQSFSNETAETQNNYEFMNKVTDVTKQVGLTILLFMLTIISLLNMPYFNKILVGKNEVLDPRERIAMYDMFGKIFMAISALVIAGFLA